MLREERDAMVAAHGTEADEKAGGPGEVATVQGQHCGHQEAAQGRDGERAGREAHREGTCRTGASALRDEGAGRDADQRPHIDHGETADQHHERELAVVLGRKRARQSDVEAEAESALETFAPEHDGEASSDPMQPRDHGRALSGRPAPFSPDRIWDAAPEDGDENRLDGSRYGRLGEPGLVALPRGFGEVSPRIGGPSDPLDHGGKVLRRTGLNQPARATVLHHFREPADGRDDGRAAMSHGLDRDPAERLGQARGNRDDVGPDVMRARIRHERHQGDDMTEPERLDRPRELSLAFRVLEGVADDADVGPDVVGQLGDGLDQDVLTLDAADPSEHQQPQPTITPVGAGLRACRAVDAVVDHSRRMPGRKREGARRGARVEDDVRTAPAQHQA